MPDYFWNEWNRTVDLNKNINIDGFSLFFVSWDTTTQQRHCKMWTTEKSIALTYTRKSMQKHKEKKAHLNIQPKKKKKKNE